MRSNEGREGKATAKALRHEVAWRIPRSKEEATVLQLRVRRRHEEIGVEQVGAVLCWEMFNNQLPEGCGARMPECKHPPTH